MNDTQGRYDSLIDIAGGLVMALAGSWSLYVLVPGLGLAATGAVGLLIFATTHAAMRLIGRPLVLSSAAPMPIAPLPFDEEALDRPSEEEEASPPELPADDEPLLLDDILAEMAPSSRVVRLFAPEDMPTAGELKDRIDRHLAGPPDAQAAPQIVALPDASDRLAAAMGRARPARD